MTTRSLRYISGRLFRRAGAAVLVATVCAAPALPIDYEPSSLERMLGLADLIVSGTVESVGEETITVSIGDSMAGAPAAGERIQIVRYDLYSYPGGRAAYAPGQSFVWLLTWRPEPAVVGSPSQWHVFGAEGEGELPAESHCVYLRAELVPGSAGEQREIQGRSQQVRRFASSLFWDAAAGYRRCVRWTPASGEERARPRTVCAPEELAEYATRSALHRYLASTVGDDPAG